MANPSRSFIGPKCVHVVVIGHWRRRQEGKKTTEQTKQSVIGREQTTQTDRHKTAVSVFGSQPNPMADTIHFAYSNIIFKAIVLNGSTRFRGATLPVTCQSSQSGDVD